MSANAIPGEILTGPVEGRGYSTDPTINSVFMLGYCMSGLGKIKSLLEVERADLQIPEVLRVIEDVVYNLHLNNKTGGSLLENVKGVSK